MSANDELLRFVRDAMRQGVPQNEIREVLLGAGWGEPQIRRALSRFRVSPFGLPVPSPRVSEPREAFIYLILFATMYLSAFNLGNLAFQFINQIFPGAYVFEFDRAVRWSTSVLIVTLPVFFCLTRMTNRAARKDPGKPESEVRKKLTYLTLALSSFVLIGVFTCVVYNFLGDALTARFVLKALTTGLIAGGAFGYYLKDVRDDTVNPASAKPRSS